MNKIHNFKLKRYKEKDDKNLTESSKKLNVVNFGFNDKEIITQRI